jgi:hypothetical protein
LLIFITFMQHYNYFHTTNKKMAESKVLITLAVWLTGFLGFSYTLLTVDWDNVKAVILLIIGTAWSFVHLCRAIIRLIREIVDLRHYIREKRIELNSNGVSIQRKPAPVK